MFKQILVVGAGIYGATIVARMGAADVTVLESRDVVGGNVYSEFDTDAKCHVSKHGAHIFHTNSDAVWNFVNDFATFNDYRHYVKGLTNAGQVVDLPFSMSLFSQLLGLNTPEEARQYFDALPKVDGDSVESWCLSNIGEALYEEVVKNYTEKQWGGVPCAELPADIIRRLPKRLTFDSTYFNNAKYQGMPVDGYTAMIERMLERAKCVHLGVQVDLGHLSEIAPMYDHVFFSGEIDRLLDYRFGPLPYRGLRFETKVYDTEVFQGAPVINDLTTAAHTRTIEHKMFYPNTRSNKTVVTKEFPEEFLGGTDTPYYPVRTNESSLIHEKYYSTLKALIPNITIGGRLGAFQYFDMDQVVAMALKDARDYDHKP